MRGGTYGRHRGVLFMLRPKPSISAVAVLAGLAAHASVAAAAAQPAGAGKPTRTCESLATLKLPDTTISLARTESSGSFTPPGGKPLTGLPAFCRVAGVIRPSADSQIEFEVWMPAAGWNRKFEGVGNGGFAGSISHFDLARAVTHGYATASTDTGHEAAPVDATWALGHPEKIVDFGHRASTRWR